jgi:hypothetical protein
MCLRMLKAAYTIDVNVHTAVRHSSRCFVPAHNFRLRVIAPSFSARMTSATSSRCRPATTCRCLRPPAPAAPIIDFPKIDKGLVKTNFFEYLDFALQFAPAQGNEKEIRAKLARIGVGPSKTFNFKDLPLEKKLEFGLGMKEGQRKVEEAVANVGKTINGWRVSGLPGDSAHYNGDWLKRAIAAQAGIYVMTRRKQLIRSRVLIATARRSTAASTTTH